MRDRIRHRSAPPSGRSVLVLIAVVALLGACTVEPGTFPGHEQPRAIPAAPAPTPGHGLLADTGVSADPCPTGTNPDNGCIHLGALLDTSGPFAAFGEPALAGAQAFWHHVNEQGGVVARSRDGLQARFDVQLERHVADTSSDVNDHLEHLDRMESEVLALALSMGTATTQAALPVHERHDLVAAPLSWWSGWPFAAMLAQSGASYCLQAINGMDWARAELGGGTHVDRVMVVHAPDGYGEDVRHAVEHWSDPDGPGGDHPRVPFTPSEHAVVVEPGGDVTPAVEQIREVAPDVVVLATGPQELAGIAAAVADWQRPGLLVGMAPTFEPSLLDDDPVAAVLEDRYVRVGSVGPLTQGGPAYVDMRESLGLGADRGIDASDDRVPANDAWIAGWVAQYPLHHALRDAITAGDLTRAGLAHVVQALTVSYDRALPETDYEDAPNDAITRRTFVYRPDRDGLMGQRLLADAYVGPTARRLHVSRPCTDR